MDVVLALWIIRVCLSPISTICSICVVIAFLLNPKKLFPCVHVSFIFFQALCDAIYNIHHLEAVFNFNLHNDTQESNISCVTLGMTAQFGSTGIYLWNFVILIQILYEIFSTKFDHQHTKKYWHIGSHLIVWSLCISATIVPVFFNQYQRIGSMGCWISYKILFTRTIPIAIVMIMGLITIILILTNRTNIKQRTDYILLLGTSQEIASFPTQSYLGVISFSFIVTWSPVFINLMVHHLSLVNEGDLFSQVLMCINIAFLVVHGSINAFLWWHSGIIHQLLNAPQNEIHSHHTNIIQSTSYKNEYSSAMDLSNMSHDTTYSNDSDSHGH